MMDHPVTDQEIHEAALQYVRKVSGYRKSSRANTEVFEAAVTEIAQVTRKLIAGLNSTGEFLGSVRMKEQSS